ncbi:MAG: vitamin K epoxide reductase family protein [Chloroflexota bacterium]
MAIRRFLILLLTLLFLASVPGSVVAAQPPSPVVRAVMFWMDGCGHCHDVLDNVLPPLQARYGEQLQIHLVEVTSAEEVEHLYTIAANFGVPRQNVGVPFLLIGNAALVGSQQIPAELPGLIEQHLANGGIDYPNVPELAPLLPETGVAPAETESETAAAPAAQPVQTESETASAAPDAPVTESETAPAAPVADGHGLAIAVLVGMTLALLYAGLRLLFARRGRIVVTHPAWLQKAIPLLAVAGLAVAGYLAYVETQAVAAVCGPVGDCNAVQTSEYAYLFGIPIGVLGVIGYVVILAAWGWSHWQRDPRAPLALLGVTIVGVLFSIYLTYLEPFVIGAVCAWCLTSAVIMALLLLASVDPAARQLAPARAQRQRGYR